MHLLSFSLIALVAGSLVVSQHIGNRKQEATETLPPSASAMSPTDSARGLYHFYQPDRIYVLPSILQEISGIALADNNTMYCIQDENGTVYKYDLRKGEIIDDVRFAEPGDYEDLTIVNGDIYVLRSDATLFRMNLKNSSTINSYPIPLSCSDMEGLYYSASDDLMYVACKNRMATDDESSRSVYQFSLNAIDRPIPSIVITQEDIQKRFPVSAGKSKKQKMSFNPSGIAVHPLTGDLYVLSATQRYVGVFSEGVLQNLIQLSAEIYYKPEGITFSDNGDLYLSSEGSKDGKHKPGIYFLPQQIRVRDN